jgi:DNA-binding transcriptional LysR family regulator
MLTEVRCQNRQGLPDVLTLRQIEVLRAVMVTGSITGAAKLLRVSAPGISRLMKYTERSLGLRIFDRRQGRYVPSPYAKDVFEQVNTIYSRVDDLKAMLDRMKSGKGFELRIGSVPSIANVMVPRAVQLTRQRYPDIRADLNILKIEEAIDYIMLNKGELVAMSYALEHPAIEFVPLAEGKLYCIVPDAHPLAVRDSISSAEMVRHPLIGIDPNDPYGNIMANIFRKHALDYDIVISARFGTTVCSLVAAGLGIAVIDQYTVADGAIRGIKTLEIEEPTWFQTYIAKRRDAELSTYAESFVHFLRKEMEAVNTGRGRGKTKRRAQ